MFTETSGAGAAMFRPVMASPSVPAAALAAAAAAAAPAAEEAAACETGATARVVMPRKMAAWCKTARTRRALHAAATSTRTSRVQWSGLRLPAAHRATARAGLPIVPGLSREKQATVSTTQNGERKEEGRKRGREGEETRRVLEGGVEQERQRKGPRARSNVARTYWRRKTQSEQPNPAQSKTRSPTQPRRPRRRRVRRRVRSSRARRSLTSRSLDRSRSRSRYRRKR